MKNCNRTISHSTLQGGYLGLWLHQCPIKGPAGDHYSKNLAEGAEESPLSLQVCPVGLVGHPCAKSQASPSLGLHACLHSQDAQWHFLFCVVLGVLASLFRKSLG